MKDAKKEGPGVLYHPNGSKFCEGVFKNDTIDGKFTLNYPDNSRYEGDVKNGLREGYGVLYKRNGTNKKGIWKNDKFDFRGHCVDFDDKK